ncbi:MAG: hypothetical protein ABJD11_08060 [Gemmatimonadota bacterium]
MRSPSGWAEIPCAQCGTRVSGIDWGELCPACRQIRLQRARRLSLRISLPATLLLGLYVIFRMPPTPLARIYGALAVVITYVVLRRIVTRVAMELLPRPSLRQGERI